ncbi:MAG: tryptophan synthase subunit alpha [Hadesarchaea archaeon]|nr:tryptophan synthase subunit alpha [Hadesarchaea archaeon]
MSGIAARFTELRGRGEGALIAFITAGDPRPSLTPRMARALLEHADMLELGIPFSDPIADGPSIQAASERALSAGTTPETVLDIIERIRRASEKPIVVLSYYNIVFKFGVERFARVLAEAGGDGLIVPDLPAEESAEVARAARKRGLDLILLASPTTTPERMRLICELSSGFLYLVSLLGVTGARERLSSEVRGLVARARSSSKGELPLAVGFGISRPEHVREVLACGADGAIVGSAFVDIVAKHRDDGRRMLRELSELAKAMKEATRLEHQLQRFPS